MGDCGWGPVGDCGWGPADKVPAGLSVAKGTMQAIGYIVMQHGLGDSRPVKAYKGWMDRIPGVYWQAVLNEAPESSMQVAVDPHCLSLLKHYRSLMPMAMQARKPIFCLKAADCAIGAHTEAVKSCYADFEVLASRMVAKAGIPFA